MLGTDAKRRTVIGNLYYPDSPHEFSVIGIEILGEVCEQFLGKVIRLTAGHQAKVEERSSGLTLTCALDGSPAPRRLSAMPCEPSPALTEVELLIMSPELCRDVGRAPTFARYSPSSQASAAATGAPSSGSLMEAIDG